MKITICSNVGAKITGVPGAILADLLLEKYPNAQLCQSFKNDLSEVGIYSHHDNGGISVHISSLAKFLEFMAKYKINDDDIEEIEEPTIQFNDLSVGAKITGYPGAVTADLLRLENSNVQFCKSFKNDLSAVGIYSIENNSISLDIKSLKNLKYFVDKYRLSENDIVLNVSIFEEKVLPQCTTADILNVSNQGLFDKGTIKDSNFFPKGVNIRFTEYLPTLSIEDHHVETIVGYLNKHPNITVLNLTGANITDKGLSLLSQANYLKELNLAKCKNITGNDFQINPAIERLFFNDIRMGEKGLKVLGKCKNLQILDLSDIKLPINSIDATKALVECPSLWWLNLSACNLTDDVLVAIAKSASIQTLILNNNKFNCIVAEALADTEQLKHLVLNAAIIEKGALERIGKSQSLLVLNLNNTKITIDLDDAKALAALPWLKELALNSNNLEDESIINLAIELQNNTTLKKIDLSNNKITDIGAMAIASVPNLEVVIRCNNKIGVEGESALMEVDPQKLASYGRRAGIIGEITSLERMSIFTIKRHKMVVQNLPEQSFEQGMEPRSPQ